MEVFEKSHKKGVVVVVVVVVAVVVVVIVGVVGVVLVLAAVVEHFFKKPLFLAQRVVPFSRHNVTKTRERNRHLYQPR